MRKPILAALLVAAASGAAAQGYPARPVRVVVPWPPGQATDLAMRVVAQKLSEQTGQPFVIDNRAGAGGMIGTDVAAKAAPDGYTILAASSGPVTINPIVQAKVPYDPERDLASVGITGMSPYLLVTTPSFPANNIREFIALVRANPDKYTFASSGTGATAHLIAEWFNSRAGLKAVHVPYKGSGPALTDVMSGQVAYAIETLATTNPLAKSGKLKALGISIAKGSTLAPTVPTIEKAAELAGFDAGAWLGVMVPTGTPKPIIDRLAAEIAKAMTAPDLREKYDAISVEIDYRPPEAMTEYLKAQKAIFSQIVKSANIKPE